MKCALHLDLDDEFEMESLMRFLKSDQMALALIEIKAYIANIWNESDDEDTIKVKDVYEKIIGELDRRGVYPEELIS